MPLLLGRKMSYRISVIAVMTAIAAAFVAPAATITYTTPAGSSTVGGPVNAQADFTLGAGTIELTLTNLLSNPTDVAQLISDIFFSASNGPSTLTLGTVTESSGTELTVDKHGTSSLGSTVSAGWLLSNDGTTFHLDRLAAPGQKAHLIIGAPGASGTYSNANGSIAGNGPTTLS
jgi:hypothetical protein